MGLLNSTHVMAVITPNTKGSQWVPYEYGRVKDPLPVTLQAACWIDNALLPSALPEYLYLGAMTRSEADVKTWLRSERSKYGLRGQPGFCHWSDPIPASLES
jgi:hypothetical protein